MWSARFWPLYVIELVVLLLCLPDAHAWGSSKDKVLLKDVGAITLHAGSMTTGRRSSPVSQLMYKGDTSLGYYAPSTVQCKNRGHDGYDVQWECVAELAPDVKFKNINVICEGYDYPEDPNILQGSCGLEYTLEYTGSGGHNSNKQHYNYNQKYDNSHNSESSFSTLFMLLCVGGVIYFVYTHCLPTTSQQPTPSSSGNPPPSGRNRLYPDLDPPPYPGNGPSAPEENGAPPPYGWADDCMPGAGNQKTRPGTQSRSSSYTPPRSNQSETDTRAQGRSADQSGPGFWSGATLGGIAGYLFGNRNRGHQNHYNRGYGGGGWGNGGGGWGNGGGGWGNGGGWGSNQYSTGRGWGSNWFGGGQRGPSYPSHGGGGSSWFGGGSASRSSAGSGSTRTSSGFGGTSRR